MAFPGALPHLVVALLASTALSAFAVSGARAQGLDSFAVLAGSAVTDAGSSVITGNVGVSPGNSVTGFPPGTTTGSYTIHNNDAVAAAAQAQLTTAYNVLAGRATTMVLTGQDLGGMTLQGGVYSFSSSAQLTGELTLDGQGDPDSVFIFNIGSTLTTADFSSITLIGDADPNNVFFRVGSSATLGESTEFIGKILALSSITLITDASIDCGAALARNAGVSLDNNVISICFGEPVVIDGNLPDDASETDEDVLEAINDYVGSGGILPIGFAVLDLLTPEELADALEQLAGETATATTPAAMQAMDSFFNLLDRRTGSGSGPGSDGAQNQYETATVSVMGYAAETPMAGGSAFAGIGDGTSPVTDTWQIWSTAYGGYTFAMGDGGTGSHDRESADYGIAFGVERYVSPDAMFGLALSGGGTTFNLDDSLGSGKSAMLQAALYARSEFDQAYASGALAFGMHDMHTDRYVTFAGLDHFEADFVTHVAAANVEVGYDAGWLTPFVGLRGQIAATPGYEETTVSGASTFALGYAEQLALTGRIEIGARADWTAEVEAGTLDTYASIAWAHSFSTGNEVEAYFIALPGSTFTVAGAEAASDAVLVSLGTELNLHNGVYVSGAVDGGWSGNALSYSGSARLGYSW